MKHRKMVSMIGALIIIISAVMLITGCPRSNNNLINGVWKSTTPPPQGDLDSGLTDVYLAFDGQMHIYAYRKGGVLYKGASCAYSISGDNITLAGRGTHKFNINNNTLTIDVYMGNWVKVNTPTLQEVQNAKHASD